MKNDDYVHLKCSTHARQGTYISKIKEEARPVDYVFFQPLIPLLFPGPFHHIPMSIYLPVLFIFVGEDIISAFLSAHSNDLGASYHVMSLIGNPD